MKDLMQRQIDNGFRDLQGLAIDARIPLKDSLVNELLAEALQEMARPGEAPASAGGFDLKQFAGYIQKAEVKATDGLIAVEVKIRI